MLVGRRGHQKSSAPAKAGSNELSNPDPDPDPNPNPNPKASSSRRRTRPKSRLREREKASRGPKASTRSTRSPTDQIRPASAINPLEPDTPVIPIRRKFSASLPEKISTGGRDPARRLSRSHRGSGSKEPGVGLGSDVPVPEISVESESSLRPRVGGERPLSQQPIYRPMPEEVNAQELICSQIMPEVKQRRPRPYPLWREEAESSSGSPISSLTGGTMEASCVDHRIVLPSLEGDLLSPLSDPRSLSPGGGIIFLDTNPVITAL